MDNKKLNDNTTEIQQDQPPESWTRFSFVFSVFLPLAGLAIFFKQKHILSRLLLQLDRNCVSVFCPSLSRREKLLKWAGSRLPDTWSSQSRTLAGGVADLWSDGSLLCTLINSAIPGACPNPHRHWKKPPLHAQAIAYKYLGVIPIFTDNDLSGNLTVNFERSFIHYLNELEQAISKLLERNDTPKSVSVHYIVRGMGLYSGEQHRKTVFYIYPNMNTAGHNSNILVHIRGPYATYGKAVIPNFHNDLFTTPEINITTEILTTKKLLNGNVVKPNNLFMKNFSLPFMQYHKKHLGDNIVIDVAMEDDRAKVTYIPKNYGMYEIIMIANGELLRGCPFNVHILNNVSGVEDSFDAEGRAEDILSLRRRKILSKTIDFIDEQMPVADVLMIYKNKGNSKPESNVKSKETNDILVNDVAIERDEVNEQKNLSESVVLQKQPCNLIQPSEKNEEDKEACSKGTHMDKSQLNKDNTNVQKYEILEKQNSESASENHGVKVTNANAKNLLTDHVLIENDQTRSMVHTANNYSDNRSTHKVARNDVSVGLRLKSTTESANDYKKVGDVVGQKKQMFNTACKPTYSELIPDSVQKVVEVNRLKIPEKFCETQNVGNKNINNELNSKCFKNFINASNKRETSNHVSAEHFENEISNKGSDSSARRVSERVIASDDNNNNITNLNRNDIKQNFFNTLHRRNSKAEKSVPRRFLQHQHLEPPLYPTNTSPICPNHIVPEVENQYQKMSVAEKRKIFAKKVPDGASTSPNSSFSETENAEGSPNGGHFRHFEGLSVLNYLGSLKSSANKQNRYSLCSATSLPNISSMQAINSVKERRNFWERMSTSSSSLSLNSEASSRRKPTKITETERCKLIWRKPVEIPSPASSIDATDGNSGSEKNTEMSRSVDDILSLNFVPQEAPKKFKSMDHSLDKCSVMSIEERKRILLKQNYERERAIQPTRCLRNGRIFVNQKAPSVNKRNEEADDFVFSSVSERIKKFDSAYNLSSDKTEEEILRKPNQKNEPTECINKKPDASNNDLRTSNHHNSQEFSQPEVLTVKSHFKRAIKYFKNLEEKSIHKSKTEKKPNDYRRHPSRKRGGSLNLPSVTKRFFVSNLYNDIVGDKKGSFKGAVNRSALVEALATFSRRENHIFRDDEDDITYEIFQKRAKIKRRRSIKSVFDIYY